MLRELSRRFLLVLFAACSFASETWRGLGLLLILLVLWPVSGFSQTTGAIAGTVRDPSGAVVTGAKVVARSNATDYRRSVTTNESGEFLVPLLPPGNYEVSIEASGFRKAVFPSVTVSVTETIWITTILIVGDVTESVSVSSGTPLIQSDGPQLGRVIDSGTVSTLPLATRNFTQILTLSPGASSYLPDSTGVGRNTQLISVNGARAMQNNFEVNGVDVNSMGTNGPIMLPVPAPESIQEFKVQTALYDAAFGRSAGGSVQMVTKDGTNSSHGAAYEYLSNDVLNANNPFLKAAGAKRPVLQRNTFGVTWGGPIRRDRAFLFASYQGARERNGASIINSISSNVLIAPGLTDDRSAATLLSTFKPKLSNGQAATSIDSSALALLNTKLPNGKFLIPTPQADGHYSGSAVSRSQEDQFNANFDYLRHRDSFSVKSFVANGPRTLVLAGFRGVGPNVPGFPSDDVQNNRLIVIQDIHSFSSSLLNDVRIGYDFFRNDTSPEEPVKDSDLGIARSNAAQFPGLGMIRIAPGSGGLIIGSEPTNSDGRRANSTTTLADTVSVSRGTHNFRTGAEFRYNMVNFDLKTFSRGQIDFQNFNDFLVGAVSKSWLGSGITERSWRAIDYNFFVQDDWKLFSNLTVNLGLRYELDQPPYDTRGRFATFDPSLYQPRPLVQNGVPVGPPIEGFIQASNAIPSVSTPGVPKVDKRIVNSVDPWNFAPRFGFAWSPRRQTVVRGGYGIYISRSSFQYVTSSTFVPPIYIIGIKSSAPLNNPFLSLPNAGQFPAFIPGVALSGNVFDRNLDTPYFQQFGLSAQEELGKKMLLEVGYVGTRGLDLFRQVAINQAPLASMQAPIMNAVTGAVITTNTPANASLRAPLQGVDISGFSQFQSTAQSTYHSLQATLTKEMSFGLQFLTSYTYSKSIDNSSGQGGGAGTAGVINPSAVGDVSAILGDQRNDRGNRGVSDFDRTHRLVFSSIWDLPQTRLFNNFRGGRLLLSNWKMSGIAVVMSGLPIDVVDTGAGSLYGLAGGSAALARPSLAPGFSSCSAAMRGVPSGYFFNPAVFARPIVNAGQVIPSSRGAAVADAVGTDIGNVGRNCLRGPRQANVDLAITKRFPLSESRNIEFGAEFFNWFNEVNLANPVSNFNAVGASGKINPNTGQVISPGDFGRVISTSNNPRIIQFVLKFNY
jgi:carboxypeptidase family protein/TonB-dependent receptor-like protein